MTTRPSLGSASNCRISWSQEWHFFGRETQIRARHHCPGSRIVIRADQGTGSPTQHRWAFVPWCLPRLLLPVEERKKKKKLWSWSDLRNQISLPALVIRFANQVHRSPSLRSLATACFPFAPGDCPRTEAHGRIPRLICLKNPAGPGPFATSLCSLISAHINLLDVRIPPLCQISPLSARPSTTSHAQQRPHTTRRVGTRTSLAVYAIETPI